MELAPPLSKCRVETSKIGCPFAGVNESMTKYQWLVIGALAEALPPAVR